MNSNPKYRQNWILDCLKANPTENYTGMFAKYSPKFALSKVTFDKDWKKANSVFKSYQDLINKAKLDESIAQEKKAVKLNILTKIERQKILSDIARGDIKTWKEANGKFGTERLEFYDPVKYIAELNKMDGSYIQNIDLDIDSEITEIIIKRASAT